MRIRESDLARRLRASKPGGNENRRSDRPTLRRCDELGEDVVRVGEVAGAH